MTPHLRLWFSITATYTMIWRAREFVFRFPRPALVMGILNVTPDSFSDGGRFFSTDAAVAQGLELIRQGADMLDVGGESTRPGATPVTEEQEMARVLPVVTRLAGCVSVPLSIDTYKPAVAAAAVDAGASIVNDIGANRADFAMASVIRESGAGYVMMHMQGTPASMQENPEYDDVVREVTDFFVQTLRRLALAGVREEQVCLDIGIGFGKRLEHNLELLAHLRAFRDLGRPLLLGVSRKSFIGRIIDAPVESRLPGGLAIASLAAQDGVAIVRTHDVAETVQALRVAEAIFARRNS